MNIESHPFGVQVELTPQTPEHLAAHVRAHGVRHGPDYLLPRNALATLAGMGGPPRAGIASRATRGHKAPGFGRLHDYQSTGVDFLSARASALLGDDMGIGKSVQSLMASDQVADDQTLVLCPASLTGNWAAEIHKWLPDTRYKTCGRSCIPDTDIVIVSYDTAKAEGALRDELMRRKWSVVIMDEAHRAQGTRTGRHALCVGLDAEHRWLLTGTPLWNQVGGAFGLLALAGHPLGNSRKEFRRRYYRKDPEAQVLAASRLSEDLGDWVLRRLRAEVLELPDQHDQFITIPTPEFPSDSFGDLMRSRNLIAQAKAPTTALRAAELVEDGHSVIVFSCFTKPIERIKRDLQAAGVPVSVIDGRVPSRKRQQIADRFAQADTPQVLIGQIVAAGEGYNLTASSRLIHNDLSFLASEHDQGTARAHRLGQTQSVEAIYMVSTCDVDTAMWSLLEKKRRLGQAFDDARSPLHQLQEEVRRVKSDRITAMITTEAR